MKKRKLLQLAVLLLALVLAWGMMPVTRVHAVPAFVDVPEDKWYHPFIMYLYSKGIVGVFGSSGEFRPDDKVIREHASKMICLAAGLDHEGRTTNFTDSDRIAPDMEGYIAALVDKAAIGGFPDGSFRPRDKIKRGHAAKIVALAFDLRRGYISVELNDLPSNDPVVREAIATLASNGIVGGYGESGEFRPGNEVSRAELCKILFISMAVSAVQKMEDEITQSAVNEAQALVDALPYSQIPETVDALNARIQYTQADVYQRNLYGDYYWRDVRTVNRMITDNGLARTVWAAGETAPPADWSASYPDWWMVWSSASPKRITTLAAERQNMTGTLDARDLTKVTDLYLGDNQLTGLQVERLLLLRQLTCGGNNLVALNLEYLPSLAFLVCGQNALTSFDVRNLDSLEYLYCAANGMTSRTLSGLPVMNTLRGEYNNLATLDVSGLPLMTQLELQNNDLSSVKLHLTAPYSYIDLRQNRLPNKAAIINGSRISWDTGNFFFSPQQ